MLCGDAKTPRKTKFKHESEAKQIGNKDLRRAFFELELWREHSTDRRPQDAGDTRQNSLNNSYVGQKNPQRERTHKTAVQADRGIHIVLEKLEVVFIS